MSNWTKTLTIVVPEVLIPQANQLALALGTSEDDSETFKSADFAEFYYDEIVTDLENDDGESYQYIEKVLRLKPERYSVCSTRAVDKIFDYVGMVDTTENTLLAEGLAALSFVTVTIDAEGAQTITGNDPSKICVVVDMEPFAALSLLGLHRIEAAE